MDKLARTERDKGIVLPEIYKDFYWNCSGYTPENLVGTDLLNKYHDLYDWAVELLKEDEVDNFLQQDDFVFMMHQGYIFWYFKADGNTDPTVFMYYEGRLKPEICAPFSSFISVYIDWK